MTDMLAVRDEYRANVIVYSLVETAKANDIEPYEYLLTLP